MTSAGRFVFLLQNSKTNRFIPILRLCWVTARLYISGLAIVLIGRLFSD